MTTYAIGDVQGCHASLMALLERIHAETPDPRLIFVGDLVNRGPQSLETLRTIRSLGDKAIALLGNHDLHLLAVANGIRRAHESDTLDDILQSPDRDEWLDWLRQRPLAHVEDGYLMVHAGVLPQWSTQQTLALAHEVEAVLRGPDWVDFLRQMYGNFPAKWDDGLSGADRIRCIVNALTRLRFCTPDGTMELTSKEAHGANLPGYQPWFDAPERQTADTTIVFGHWSARGLILEPKLIGLDTGCIWGGKLTALRLSDRKVLQVKCPKYLHPLD
ncbi:MAG: symmetrical bis(5'-nucleosyl)-tetraphosphatase [Proteobacteria bacterium]|nr:symmetrical bis(5'-nucleosyl)-tetraphosphatase [Pseudomonadota bacterium]